MYVGKKVFLKGEYIVQTAVVNGRKKYVVELDDVDKLLPNNALAECGLEGAEICTDCTKYDIK